MPAQEFNNQELSILSQAQAELFQNHTSLSDQLNRTRLEQKAFFVATVQSKIDACQARLDNVDTIVAGMKAQMQAECNATIALLSGLKTKLENLPE